MRGPIRRAFERAFGAFAGLFPGQPAPLLDNTRPSSDGRATSQLWYAAAAQVTEEAPIGSPYLYALGCAYLSSPEGSDAEATLERLFLDQALAEECDGVDGDEVLTALCGAADV